MKKILIVANWKSNMTIHESDSWIEQMANSKWQIDKKEVVVCPPFTLLEHLHSRISTHNSQFKLGAQDVSPFPKGAYTGEVAAFQIAEFADFVIIGHSERRKYFHEDDQVLANKVDMALEARLQPIFCIQDAHTIVPSGVKIVAYEPVFAIGTGEPDSPQNAEDIAAQVKESSKIETVLYGGSVNGQNVRAFTEMAHIDGVLVGSASLDSDSFSQILQNA